MKKVSSNTKYKLQPRKQPVKNNNGLGRAKRRYNQSELIIKQSRNVENIPDMNIAPLTGYVRQLIHENCDILYRMPLMPMGRSFLKRVKYRVSIPVSTAGRLFTAIKPSYLAYYANGSTASPFCTINNAAYDPNSVANVFANGGLFDHGIVSTEGLNVAQAEFDQICVVSFHCCLSITGVSNLNKKGQIYIAEDRSNGYYSATDIDDSYGAQNYCNAYPMSSLAKLYHCKKVEIPNTDSSSVIEYHYVPARSYSDMTIVRPSDKTVSATGEGNNNKHFIVIVDGADSTTQIVYNFEIVLQMEPKTSYLNNYLTAPTTCLLNPDPVLRVLEQDKDVVLRTDVKQGHNADYIFTNSLMQNYNTQVSGGRKAISNAIKVVTS